MFFFIRLKTIYPLILFSFQIDRQQQLAQYYQQFQPATVSPTSSPALPKTAHRTADLSEIAPPQPVAGN